MSVIKRVLWSSLKCNCFLKPTLYLFNYGGLEFICTGFVKEFPFQIYKPKYLLKLIAYIQHQNYEAPLFCYLITKKFLSNFLFNRLDIHNSGVFSCESHYFSSHIIERNMKVSFITPKKTNFLLITQDVFCFMLYISCKYGLKWCRE